MSDTTSRGESAPPLKLLLYNLHLLSDAELERSFIARKGLFRSLLDDVVSEPPNSRPQHHLIVGQRGMGKTTLLLRLAVELRQDPHRATFIPLSFPEEQHIGIDRLSKFWLNCLDALADALEKEGKSGGGVAEIDAVVEEGKKRSGDEKEAERFAREAFTEAWRRTSRRPVLLIDNFNLLLNRLKDHDYELRGYFTAPGAPVLVGACTDIANRLEDYGAAFYEGFKHHWLHPLTLAEMSEVVEQLAREAKRKDVLDRVAQERPRMATLRDLTGGNPRTAVLLFDLFAKDFSRDAYGDLERLLDIVTPLYQSRLEQLSDQSQVIVAALAQEWRPITVAEICQATGLENKSVSPQLGRLEDLGLVEKTAVFPSKRAGYQIAERFFNVWYLMRFATRRQRAGLNCLTRFLEAFHTPDERARLAQRLLSETSLSCDQAIYAMAVADSLCSDPGLAHDLSVKAQLDLVDQMDGMRERIAEILDASVIDHRIYHVAELRKKLRQAVPQGASVTGKEFADLVLGSPIFLPGGSIPMIDRHMIAQPDLTLDQVEVVVTLAQNEARNLSERFPERVHTWFRSKLQNGDLLSWDNAEQISSVVLAAPDSTAVSLVLAYAAPIAKRNLSEEAFEKTRECLELDLASDAQSWLGWGAQLHKQFCRYKEAEQAYRKAINLDPSLPQSWNNLGCLLSDYLGQQEEAEQAFRHATALDSNYAAPWHNLGNLLGGRLKRFEEAMQAYHKAIDLDPNDAQSWHNLGILLQDHLGQYEEVEKAYRMAIALNPKYAQSWHNLGTLLQDHLGRYEEAEEAYRKAIEFDPKSATTWCNLGNLLGGRLKRFEEAERAYHKAIEFDPNDAQPWYGLGILLASHLGRHTEAEQAYGRAIALNPKFAAYWNNLGVLLQDHLKRYEEAEQAYRKAIDLDPKSAHPWNNLGVLLQLHLARYEEAEEAYRQAMALDPKYAARWNGMGNLLADYLGRFDDAREAFGKAIELDPADDVPRHNLAFLLRDFLGDPDGARRILADLRDPEQCRDTRALHDALFAAYDDNWGLVTTAVRQALQAANYALPPGTRDDWFRASAVLLHLGFGEKLVEFLKGEGADVKMLPWFAAVEAHTVGDRRHLLNVAVEARPTAEKIYDEIQKRRELLVKRAATRSRGAKA